MFSHTRKTITDAAKRVSEKRGGGENGKKYLNNLSKGYESKGHYKVAKGIKSLNKELARKGVLEKVLKKKMS